jgi:hypothetical protein
MSKHEDAPHQEPTPEQLAAADEPVHVPKGQSRGKFLLILALMIFTLVIYVVPAEFTQMFRSGDPSEESYFAWNHPRDGRQEVNARAFMLESQRMSNLLYFLGVISSDFQPYADALADARDSMLEEEQVGRTIILDRLAQDAGVEITDNELRKVIMEGAILQLSRPSRDTKNAQYPLITIPIRPISDGALLKQVLASANLSPLDYESGLSQLLRIERYESLVGIVAQPKPEAIEAAWKKQHQEYGLDFVAFDVDAARAEAESATADEATLRSWYDGLDSMTKRQKFNAEWVAERAGAELLMWNLADTTEPTKLLERFPSPQGVDPEKVAQDYYNQFANVRFRRAEEKADGATAAERLYRPFEEVADQARRESRIHAALVAYSLDVQNRIRTGLAGDVLAVEAAELGLSYIRDDSQRTQADWSSYPGVGDATFAASILRAARGDKFIPLYVGPANIAFGRAGAISEAGAPNFEDVAARALEEWRKDQAFTIANRKASDFYNAVRAKSGITEATAPLKVDEALFLEVATSQNYTVNSAGWVDEAKLTGETLDKPTEIERFKTALAFTGRNAMNVEDSVVALPFTTMTRDRVYVLRKLGKRDPPELKLEPRDYKSLRDQAASECSNEVMDELFGSAALKARFGFSFPAREAAEKEKAAQEPAKS